MARTVTTASAATKAPSAAPTGRRGRSSVLAISRDPNLIRHTVATLIVGFLFVVIQEPATFLRVGGLVTAIAYAWMAAGALRRSALWLVPPAFYYGWYSVGAGLSPIWIGYQMAGGGVFLLGPQPLFSAEIAAGYMVFLFGSWMFMVGMLAIRPNLFAFESENCKSTVSYPNVLALWSIGMVFRLVPALPQSLGALGNIVRWACMAALCLSAFRLARRFTKAEAVLFLTGTLLEIYWAFTTTSKAYVMFALLPAMWFWMLQRKIRFALPLLLVGLTIFYLAVVVPVSSESRVLGRFELGVVRSASSPLQGDALLDSLDRTLNRQFEAFPVSYIKQEVAAAGFLRGESLKYLSYAFIPRILWRDKPSVTRGSWFTVYTGFASNEEDATTSTGQTATGELYWNFGYVGVAVGMLILGALSGVIWRFVGDNPGGKVLGMLLYVNLLFGSINMSEFGSSLVSHIAIVLGVMLPMYWFAKLKRVRKLHAH